VEIERARARYRLTAAGKKFDLKRFKRTVAYKRALKLNKLMVAQ
jgi:hypothetical protein